MSAVSLNAERQRRHRVRVREGTRVVQIEIDEYAVIEWLLRTGKIGDRARRDRSSPIGRCFFTWSR